MTKLTGEEVVGAYHKEPSGPRPVAAGSESRGPHGAATGRLVAQSGL